MRSVTAGTGVAAWRAGCNKLGKVTVSLSTSESAPANAEADVLVIGVIQAPDGPSAAPGAEGVDDAIGGTLADAFTALGATGELEELSKIPGGGSCPPRSSWPSGSARRPRTARHSTRRELRRAAGTALRDLAAGARKPPVRDAGGAKTVAVALPARTADEAEAVTTGALLGGYSFRRYRSGPARDLEVTVLTGDGNAAAVKRGEVIAGAVNLVRDLVNTAPRDLSPETLAEEAVHVASDRGIAVEVLDENELRADGYGGLTGVGQGSIAAAAAGPARLHPSGGREDRRVRRQGHHVRLRRAVAQAAEVAWRR